MCLELVLSRCSFVFQHPDRSGQVTPRTKFAFERFFSELVKAVVVASICLYQHNRNRAQSERTWTTGAMSTWCLTFTALQRMTSAAYQLLLNMRIIAVAVLSVVSWKELQQERVVCHGPAHSRCDAVSGAALRITPAILVMLVISVTSQRRQHLHTQKFSRTKARSRTIGA